MSPAHFALVALVCLIWALNVVLSRLVMADWGIPPLFYAAVRFTFVAILLAPWLGRPPRPFWRMVAVAMLMQCVGFAIFIVGMRDAAASAAGIVSQVGVPATTLLSVLLLGERIGWRRIVGIVLAVAGVVILMWRPGEMQATAGLWLVMLSALMASVAVIIMKRMEGVAPLQYQGWSALLSFAPLALASWWFETGQIAAVASHFWPFVAAMSFMVLLVSILSHSLYFMLNRAHDAALVAPLMVMAPLFTVLLGVAITGDVIDFRTGLGATVTLLGVLIILLRPNAMLPLTSLILGKLR